MTYSPSLRPPQAPGSRYDAIVIGAGLLGLTAAAYLAQARAHVLMCEPAEQVGGLFDSFRRGGYHFDRGIKAVENSAVMIPMLAQLGLLERVQLRRSPIALVTQGRGAAHPRPGRHRGPFSFPG